MTNPISISVPTLLDSTRASSSQDLAGSQDVGDKSSDQQLEGEFGALLARMVLGAAVQIPIAVTGGIGVQPEVKDTAGNSSEIQLESVSDKSAALPLRLNVPTSAQMQTRSVEGSEQIEVPATATKVPSLLPIEKATAQAEQTDVAKVIDATSLPANNLREVAGLDKGKITIQGFTPILQVDDEVKVQNLGGKDSKGVLKNLPVDSKEKIALQQNSAVMEPQSSQNPSLKVSVERTNEAKVSEAKVVVPVVIPNPDSSVAPDVKKDFLKPAQVIAQTQIQPNPKTIKEHQSESEEDIQSTASQNKSLSAAKTVESSAAREIAVKPTNASQGGRGTYQQFAQMSSEHLTAKKAERVVAEKLPPLTPELSRSIIDQIAKEMTFRVRDNVSEIRLSLKPESLGEVVVNMQMEESKITAQINVDQSNVKAAVESQLPQLRQTLAERGIQIHRIDVLVADQSLARESRDQQSGKSKKRNGEGLTGIEEHDINYSPRSLGYNTIELLI